MADPELIAEELMSQLDARGITLAELLELSLAAEELISRLRSKGLSLADLHKYARTAEVAKEALVAAAADKPRHLAPVIPIAAAEDDTLGARLDRIEAMLDVQPKDDG